MEFHEFPKMVYGPDGVGVIVQNAAEEAAFLASLSTEPAEVNTTPPMRHIAVHEPLSQPEAESEPEAPSAPEAETEAPLTLDQQEAAEDRRVEKNRKARERRAAAKQAREGK